MHVKKKCSLVSKSQIWTIIQLAQAAQHVSFLSFLTCRNIIHQNLIDKNVTNEDRRKHRILKWATSDASTKQDFYFQNI